MSVPAFSPSQLWHCETIMLPKKASFKKKTNKQKKNKNTWACKCARSRQLQCFSVDILHAVSGRSILDKIFNLKRRNSWVWEINLQCNKNEYHLFLLLSNHVPLLSLQSFERQCGDLFHLCLIFFLLLLLFLVWQH